MTTREGGSGAAFSRLRSWLLDRLDEFSPAVVAVEEPILNHRGPGITSLPTARLLLGYNAIVVQVCHERQLRFEPIRANDAKKFATNDGWARKADMVAAAHARGWITKVDDEADALAILMLAEHRLSPVRRPAGPLFLERRSAE